jgi:hypothetical protein
VGKLFALVQNHDKEQCKTLPLAQTIALVNMPLTNLFVKIRGLAIRMAGPQERTLHHP